MMSSSSESASSSTTTFFFAAGFFFVVFVLAAAFFFLGAFGLRATVFWFLGVLGAAAFFATAFAAFAFPKPFLDYSKQHLQALHVHHMSNYDLDAYFLMRLKYLALHNNGAANKNH